MFSANAAGCVGKIESLVNNVNKIGAGIITLQETHFKRKGNLNEKLEEFEVFESIREKVKGGTAIAVHKSLKPVLIEEYSKEFELLVVEVKLGDKDVRLMSGYGPQENWKKEDRKPFFDKLEEEIERAKLNGKSMLIQMDANSKLGPGVVKGDPHSQSENGKILDEILKRSALIVMNGDERKCKGKITRRRITDKVKEESIIDFVIASEDVAEMIKSVEVDEERKFALTKYSKTKTGINIKESDHHSIITKLQASWNKTDTKKRVESYNFKHEESLKKFKEFTSKDCFLSEVFHDEDKSIEVKTKQLIKRLKYCITKCFRKTRVKKYQQNKETEELFEKRRTLKAKQDEASLQALKEVEELLAVQLAEKNVKIVEQASEGLSCESGGLNMRKMWKMKKRLTGTHGEPPVSMMDEHGNTVTDDKGIENIVLKRYEERLETLPIKPELEVHRMQRENLCDRRLKEAQENVTPEWTFKELDVVLKQLKNNKAKDPLDWPNELFKPENIGNDLKLAVLKLMNQIKQQQQVPGPLKYCNITSIYKNKGSRKDFENYRGIFRVVTLRNILDKLIYRVSQKTGHT